MSDANYLLLSSHAFVIPPNPGLLPTVPSNSTIANTYELVRQHKSSLTTYHEVKNTDRTLKQIIIETFDDVYTDYLRDPNIGFAGTTAMELITYLCDYFGKLLASDLATNDETMMTPYDFSLPITKLFSQIEEVVFNTKAGRVPFNKQQILHKAYMLVLKTGFYGEDCRSWNRHAIIEKT